MKLTLIPGRAKTGRLGQTTRGTVRLVVGAALALSKPLTLVAQAPVDHATTTVVLRVSVVDSSGQPVRDVEIVAVRQLQRILARARSNAAGVGYLSVPPDSADVQLIARRIGYQRADRFVHANRDTIRLQLQLIPAAQRLAGVSITAQENLKRRSYFVDADQIANSKRLILNGMDVLTKMRPDILTGRAPGCGVREVYVNGIRIVNPPLNDMAIAHMRRPVVNPWRARSATNASQGAIASEPPSERAAVWSILWTIKPEHIEQMEYKDCFDTSMPGLHGSSALYVLLKPGVAYEPGRGSYVDTSASATAPLREVVATEQEPAMPAYRRRLVGVFSAETGEPLDDARVVDVSTGEFVRTTATGTASLSFLPEGSSPVTIRREGYRELDLRITIAPGDTTALTLVLERNR